MHSAPITRLPHSLAPLVVQTAAQQALAWVNDVASGEQFEKLLAGLYETQQANTQLGQMIADSPATLDKFVIAIQGVDKLGSSYQEQIGLVDQAAARLPTVQQRGRGRRPAGDCVHGCNLSYHHCVCGFHRRRLCGRPTAQVPEPGAGGASNR